MVLEAKGWKHAGFQHRDATPGDLRRGGAVVREVHAMPQNIGDRDIIRTGIEAITAMRAAVRAPDLLVVACESRHIGALRTTARGV